MSDAGSGWDAYLVPPADQQAALEAARNLEQSIEAELAALDREMRRVMRAHRAGRLSTVDATNAVEQIARRAEDAYHAAMDLKANAIRRSVALYGWFESRGLNLGDIAALATVARKLSKPARPERRGI